MNAADFARKYFGPAKYAEPFITNDRIWDVDEDVLPPEQRSNNVIAPINLATGEAVKDFVSVVRPFHADLKVVEGPVEGAFNPERDPIAHLKTSGPRTAAWLTWFGFNKLNAPVTPFTLVGPLIQVFARCPGNPQLALENILTQMNWAVYWEPSPTE